MSPTPTGRLRGKNLSMTRSFRAPIDDVWTSVTHPDSTARWFGRWEGEGGAGNTIRVQMGFEQGMPWMETRIDACEEPRRLMVTTLGNYGWRLELLLTQSGEVTTLELVHHDLDLKGAGDVGPGWEYYMDMLVAARAGQPLPTFETYYPAQKQYYVDLAASHASSTDQSSTR